MQRYKQEYPFENVTEKDFIFPSSKREKPINYEVVSSYIKKLGKQINKRVFPYLFRHTRLQEIRGKMSVEAYEKIAGHSIETALEHYGHLDNGDAKEEMLSKVYNIKELTPQEKDEIKKLKEKIKVLAEGIDLSLKGYKLNIEFNKAIIEKRNPKEIIKIIKEIEDIAPQMEKLK